MLRGLHAVGEADLPGRGRPRHHHEGGDDGDRARAATSDVPDPGADGDRADVALGVVEAVGVLLEGRAQVVEGAHARSSPVCEVVSVASAGSIRSFASALLVWLLTVPGETPSSRAVSASLRSST